MGHAAIEARAKSHAARTRKAAANLKVKLERQINDRKNAWAELAARKRATARSASTKRAARTSKPNPRGFRLSHRANGRVTVNDIKDSVLKPRHAVWSALESAPP